MPEVKYRLHPGWVTSESAGDRHHVNAWELARLYSVPISECVIAGSDQEVGQPIPAISLYPRYDGDYSLPVKDDDS